MSYRKPVPAYVPSPPASPSSPQSMQLPHTPERNQPMPQTSADWRTVLEQVSRKRRGNTDTGSNSDRLIKEAGQDPVPERKVPSLLVGSPDGEKIPVEESNYTPLLAPSNLPPCYERRPKRKLHQYYRPPTPPLRAHTPKRRLVGNAPTFFHSCESPCLVLNDTRDGVWPQPRRMPSATALSFSTTVTQSPSFKTETTDPSSEHSEASIVWSRNADMGLKGLPKPIGYTPAPRRILGISVNSPSFSWWGQIGTWGAALGMKLRRFTSLFIC